MAGSALLGHTPNNQDDSWIVLGFFRAKGIPDTAWNETTVIPVLAPPGAPHDSRKNELIATLAVVIALIVVITGTRLSLRLFRKELRWGLDDWTIILAVLGVIAFLVLGLGAAVYGGAGRHLYDITYAEFNTFVSIMLVGQTLFYPIVGMIKVSIVLFNRRLTGLTCRKWMMFHNTLLCLLALYIVITIIVNLLICRPHPKNFEILSIGKMRTPPRWLRSTGIVPAFSAIHIVFDFVLLSVPLIVLYRMKMLSSKKIRLYFLFSIGTVSTIGAIMRPIVQNQPQHDITYQFPDFLRWTIIDIFFAITVASLPTLNCLVPKRWDSSRRSQPGLAANVSGGSAESDSKTIFHEPQVQEWAFNSKHTLTDDEKVHRKQSGSTEEGPQPDWNDYHPEMKLPV